MLQQEREIPGAERPSISPEMIERGVVRGRQLQAEAMRNAFERLFRIATAKRPPAGAPARQGGLAQACAQVIP